MLRITKTPEEFAKAVADKIDQERELAIERIWDKVVTKINAVEEYVQLPDDDDINVVADRLKKEGFELHRVSDRDADLKCRYRIVATEFKPQA